jgi:cytolysin-activating lysine-acyltransferase
VGQSSQLQRDAHATASRESAGIGELDRPPQARSSNEDRLVAPAGTRDAGVSHQREGHSMARSTKGQGSTTSNGNTGAKEGPPASDTIFTKPAPEGAAKKISEVLGEITWLMSQSSRHKQFFISDLEWLVMTPVLLKQFRLFYDKDKPIGVVFWATVNEEVEERLKKGTNRLRPQDWKSGDLLWVVEVIAPFGGAEDMVRDLQTNVFVGRSIKFVASTASGRTIKTT